MNLYIRYFDDEYLAHSVNEAVYFLKGLEIKGFDFNDEFAKDLQTYADSNIAYPKRYKVHSHVYFIVIKTTSATMEEFKQNHLNKANLLEEEDNPFQAKKKMKMTVLNENMPGWYDGTLVFKRVIAIPGTNKFQYKDTSFRAQCKANSPIDCYNRIVEHLKNRQDVDLRSQFPSAKGKNFVYSYLGETLPQK